MNTLIHKLYAGSPTWCQELAITTKSAMDQHRRRGGNYRNLFEAFQRLQWAREDELHAWRLKQFQKVFTEAAKEVPYYKALFHQVGVDPQGFKDFDHLRIFPMLEKQEIRERPEYYNNPKRKAVYVGFTGGTTGTPLASPHDAESGQYSYALMDRFYMQCGVRWEEKSVYLGANPIVPGREEKNFGRLDHATRTLFMSMRHMSDKTLDKYVHAIKNHSPQYLRGITSFIYNVARQINEQGRSGEIRIPFLFTTSETLTSHMRQAIEHAFGGRVFDYYGSTEGVPMITQCRAGRYHIVPESGHIEFLRPDGSHADPGERAEMVMTSFRSRLRPLLRYRIMDAASYSTEKCPCGLHWTIVEQIHGRFAEWIVTRHGRTISLMGDLIMKSGAELGFRELQVIQTKPDHFIVRAVKGHGYSKASEELLRKRFVANMHHDVTMEFDYTDKIERSPGGKRRIIISKLAQDLYDSCFDVSSEKRAG